MSANDDDAEGIRGTELAEDAGSGAAPPDPDDLGADGVRGDGLADGAEGRTAPDADKAAEGGLRGDGLATDA